MGERKVSDSSLRRLLNCGRATAVAVEGKRKKGSFEHDRTAYEVVVNEVNLSCLACNTPSNTCMQVLVTRFF